MNTTQPGEDLGQLLAEEHITAEREETKYRLPGAELEYWIHELSRHIPPHRFTGDGANRLPLAQHFTTTVYFDTSSRRHFHGGQTDSGQNIKVRAREYYDVHPSLAELATDPEEIVRHQPWIWLEVKRREGARTFKRRARLAKRDVPRFFPHGRVSPELLARQEDNATENSALIAIANYCGSVGEALSPTCVVNYQRLSWQDPSGQMRVTIDLDLAYFAATTALWSHDRVLSRDILGKVLGYADFALLEVKCRGTLPVWFATLVATSSLQCSSDSKFILASRAVHGD